MLRVGIAGDALQDAMKIATNIAPPMTGNIIFDGSQPGKLAITSIGETSRCHLTLPCKTEGNDIFSLPVMTAVASTKGRAQVELLFDKSVLTIKSGKYKTVAATVDVVREPALPMKGLEGTRMEPEQSAWLLASCKDVLINPDKVLGQKISHVSFQLTAEGAFIASYDGERMAYAMSSEVTGNMEFTVPLTTLKTVLETFGQSVFRMAEREGVLYVWNAIGFATIALIAPQFTIPMGAVMGRVEESREKPLAKFRLDMKEAKDFFENAKSVAREGVKNSIHIEVGKSTTKLSLKSSVGSSEIELASKATGAAKLDIDMSYLQEFMGKKFPDVCVFAQYIAGYDDDTGMIIALNQPEAPNAD